LERHRGTQNRTSPGLRSDVGNLKLSELPRRVREGSTKYILKQGGNEIGNHQ
jgi:hypothetical protein